MEGAWTEWPVSARLRHEGGTTLRLDGVYDRGGTWLVRFAPVEAGMWSYEIDGRGSLLSSGTISATANDDHSVEENPNLRGHIRVAESWRYFEYADGTAFFRIGDTNWLGRHFSVSIKSAVHLTRYLLIRYGAYNLVYSITGAIRKIAESIGLDRWFPLTPARESLFVDSARASDGNWQDPDLLASKSLPLCYFPVRTPERPDTRDWILCLDGVTP